VSDAIQFVRLQEGATLPFGDRTFDLITCNSVLEYVKPADLPYVQRQLDRVLRPGGHVVVFGTSNRLWPIEAHSGRWLVNYVPARFDRFFRGPLQRGLWPWQIRSGFGPYEGVLAELGNEQYLRARNTAQDSRGKRYALKLAARFSAVFGLSPGFLTPYLFAVLRKPLRQLAR
jgi:SAM-dependent methyltransferase